MKNIRKTPRVHLRIGNHIFSGYARDVRDGEEDALARRIVYDKYAPGEDDLEEWAATSLPVAVDLSHQ